MEDTKLCIASLPRLTITLWEENLIQNVSWLIRVLRLRRDIHHRIHLAILLRCDMHINWRRSSADASWQSVWQALDEASCLLSVSFVHPPSRKPCRFEDLYVEEIRASLHRKDARGMLRFT